MFIKFCLSSPKLEKKRINNKKLFILIKCFYVTGLFYFKVIMKIVFRAMLFTNNVL